MVRDIYYGNDSVRSLPFVQAHQRGNRVSPCTGAFLLLSTQTTLLIDDADATGLPFAFRCPRVGYVCVVVFEQNVLKLQ